MAMKSDTLKMKQKLNKMFHIFMNKFIFFNFFFQFLGVFLGFLKVFQHKFEFSMKIMEKCLNYFSTTLSDKLIHNSFISVDQKAQLIF